MRRWTVRVVRSRPELSLLRQLADHAVLSRRHGQSVAVLSSVWRHAGQLLVRWSVAHAHGAWDHELRLVRDRRRRRIPDARRPERSKYGVCRVAAWKPAAVQPGDGRVDQHRTAIGAG